MHTLLVTIEESHLQTCKTHNRLAMHTQPTLAPHFRYVPCWQKLLRWLALRPQNTVMMHCKRLLASWTHQPPLRSIQHTHAHIQHTSWLEASWTAHKCRALHFHSSNRMLQFVATRSMFQTPPRHELAPTQKQLVISRLAFAYSPALLQDDCRSPQHTQVSRLPLSSQVVEMHAQAKLPG